LVPCYNEQPNLPDLLREADLHGITDYCDILVLDDGSTDESAAILRARRWPVLSNPRNMGYGASIKIGSQYAAQKGYEFLAVMPGDNQRTFQDLIRLIQGIETGENDVVVGNKFARKKTIPWPRRWGNIFFSILAKTLWNTDYRDVLSGFKSYRVDKIKPFIHLLPDHYAFDLVFSLYCRRYNLKVLEIPVDVRYHENSTKMRSTILSGLRILKGGLAARFLDGHER